MTIERVLVLNLTRMGDLVQMLGLLGGLRRRWPQARLDVLAMRAFAGILEQFPYIDNIITLDDRLLMEGADPWAGYIELKEKTALLSETQYNVVISPVVSQQAAWLGYLIHAPEKRGMFVNADRERTITTEWTAFHLANEHHLGDRTFNLVDIFARVGGVPACPEDYRLEPGDEAREKATALWRAHGLDDLQVVGVHAGASRSNKAWEPRKFRAVIEKLLLAPGRAVVLFGGYNELALEPLFASLQHPRFVNLLGKSSLRELTALLARLDLLLVNDTGPMHLAAAMGTPVLNLSLGPVSLWETGPYLPGAAILQSDVPCHPCAFDRVCDHLRCHEVVTPEGVCGVAEALLAGAVPTAPDGTLLWRTRTDPFGLLHNVPAQPRPIRKRELYFEAKRAVWAMTVVPELDRNRDWPDVFRQDLAEHYSVAPFDYTTELAQLDDLTARTGALATALRELARLKPESQKVVESIKRRWGYIREQKEALNELAREAHDCYDLFLYARFRESSMDSNDFARLTRNTATIYADLALQLQVLGRLIRSYHATDSQ